MTRTRCLLAALLAAALAGPAAADLAKGTVTLKSAGPLAFGPDGVLFIGDHAAATIYAVATDDKATGDKAAPLNIDKIDVKIADMLGTTPKEIAVGDVKVNPATGNVFVSVTRGKGTAATPVILRVDRTGKIAEFPLKDVMCASVAIPNATEKQRAEAITGMAFTSGKLIVAGLSNEEFASKLRVIPYPFTDADKGTSIEIYHGAHGQQETRSPVRTFVPFDINGEAHVLAAYTCTPLVKFPVAALTAQKPGEKLKGTTVAELGNMNRPLDMVVYKKDGRTFLLLANSARGVMKITTDGVDSVTPITTPIRGGGTAGQKYETIKELKKVEQLDLLNDTMALILTRNDDGSLDLRSVPLP